MMKYNGVELPFTFTDHGSVTLLTPDTAEARRQLIRLTVPGESQYVEDLVAACARGEGL